MGQVFRIVKCTKTRIRRKAENTIITISNRLIAVCQSRSSEEGFTREKNPVCSFKHTPPPKSVWFKPHMREITRISPNLDFAIKARKEVQGSGRLIPGNAQVLEPQPSHDPAARGPLEESLLDKERLVDFLERVALLT